MALKALHVSKEARFSPHPYRCVHKVSSMTPFVSRFPWRQHPHACVLGSVSFTFVPRAPVLCHVIACVSSVVMFCHEVLPDVIIDFWTLCFLVPRFPGNLTFPVFVFVTTFWRKLGVKLSKEAWVEMGFWWIIYQRVIRETCRPRILHFLSARLRFKCKLSACRSGDKILCVCVCVKWLTEHFARSTQM